MKILPNTLTVVALGVASAASAQNSVPARPLSGLDDFSLPSSRPSPRAAPSPEPTTGGEPRPVATPSARATSGAPVATGTPKPRATATATAKPGVGAPRTVVPAAQKPAVPLAPRATPTSTPTSTQAPESLPAATPQAAAPSVVVPLPVETPRAEPSASEPVAGTAPPIVGPWHWLALLAGAIVIGGGAASGYALWRRRRAAGDPEQRDDRRHEVFTFEAEESAAVAPSEAAVPISAVTPATAPGPAPIMPRAEPAPDAPRAVLEIDLHIRRAGRNLLSAAVDYTVGVRNAGAVDATDIRLDIALMSAGRTQDAAIARLFAQPIAAPAVAPFALPPGGAVELGGMAMLPVESLERMEVDGRILFVPVLTIDLRYAFAGGSGQTARSYVIGIARGGAAKLQPFRLDGDPRMLDTVGTLEYTVAAVS